jgi:hypothetical protein
MAPKRKPAPTRRPSGPPDRPDVVADGAIWNAHEETWGSGDLADGKRTGLWTFHFADGALAGTAHYEDGVRHGAAEWFHKNDRHDLREQSIYVAGKIHGKRVWQRTLKGKTPGFEWFDKLGESTWRYEVPHFNGTSQPRHATRYGKTGMDAQVPADSSGRSQDLGDHMDKLEPETALFLVEECFIDVEDHEVTAGSLALIGQGLKTARGRWVYVGREGDDMFHLRFHSDDDGSAEELFVDGSELTRSFTLAADYYLTARPVFDTPRRR